MILYLIELASRASSSQKMGFGEEGRGRRSRGWGVGEGAGGEDEWEGDRGCGGRRGGEVRVLGWVFWRLNYIRRIFFSALIIIDM